MRGLSSLYAGVLFALLAICPAHAGDCANESTYKSLPGGTASDIYFHNGSSEQRRVYWIDDNGQRKLKAIVEAGTTQRQSTVASHAWVVTDATEKCLYVITASSAPLTAEIGGGDAPAASSAPAPPQPTTAAQAAPPVSPITRFGLSGFYQIGPLSKPGFVLNNMENGTPEIERVKDEWESAYWEFSEVSGTQFITIKNKWTHKFLQAENGRLRVLVTSATSEAAQWALEAAGNGPFGRLKNRADGRYLAATFKGLEFDEQVKPGNSGLWQFLRSSQPITAQDPGEERVHAAKPKRVKDDDDDVPAEKHQRKCPRGERFDSGRQDCVSIKCGRHQTLEDGECVSKASQCSRHEVYSSSMAACIPKSSMCDKNQVYSSSVGECISKSQPKPNNPPPPKTPPVKQPKAPACAYKTDGAGNCLTPQFLQCQKAFGACMRACGGKAGKCEANCEGKYAGTCGD